jgi:hypothetical protein
MVILFILVIFLAFRFLLPGVGLLPGSSAPVRQHVMTPPYMFDVTNANTIVHLP